GEQELSPLRLSPLAGLTRAFPPGSLTASRRSLRSRRSIRRSSSASTVSAGCALDSLRSPLQVISGSYSGRHLFCAWQGWPSFGSAPWFSRISAPALLYRTPPRRSPKPDAASQGVTPALLTTFTSAPFSISSSSNLFQPR